MKDRPDILNKYYSIFLIAIALGGFLWRYLVEGDFQYTALIPAIFGIILLTMTTPIKKENQLISHIAVTITLLFGLTALYMLIISLMTEIINFRRVILFMAMSLTSIFVMTLYIQRFVGIQKKKKLQSKV